MDISFTVPESEDAYKIGAMVIAAIHEQLSGPAFTNGVTNALTANRWMHVCYWGDEDNTGFDINGTTLYRTSFRQGAVLWGMFGFLVGSINDGNAPASGTRIALPTMHFGGMSQNQRFAEYQTQRLYLGLALNH